MKRWVATVFFALWFVGCVGSESPAEPPGLLDDPGFPPHPGFQTDFTRSLVSAEEIVAGGPPKDGIPAIDAPHHVTIADANTWLDPSELVFAVTVDEQTHIYPVQILMWHEIVNDLIAELPVAVTYCPLCNSGVAFDRRLDPEHIESSAEGDGPLVVDFGTTGRVRFSNLVMYDRQTETWWQQATGRAIVGRLVGTQLEAVPMLALSWADASRRFPTGRVLSRRTGHDRPYGQNPYNGYDTAARPFLYSGPATPSEYSPMTRVLHVGRDDAVAFYPYPRLRDDRVINDVIGETAIVVFWTPGTASALDAASVADGRDVGSANAFSPVVDGDVVEFAFVGDQIIDRETGSVWDGTGLALSGRYAGTRLAPIPTVQHFFFSWAAFEQ